MTDPRGVFQERLDARVSSAAGLETLCARLSNARLAAALAGVATFWFVFVHHGASPLWMAAPVAAFAILALRHDRALTALARARRAAAFYRHALAKLDGGWQGLGADGSKLAPRNHAYASSLDLFGRGSLFQFLSTARTDAGEIALARWLLAPAAPEEARARQQAVAELAPRLDLREELHLIGDDIRAGLHAAPLIEWAAAPRQLPSRALRAAAFLLPPLTLAGLAHWYLADSRILFLVSAALQATLAYRLRPVVNRVLESIAQPAAELALVANLFERLERETFAAPRLVVLRGPLDGGAARHIAHLAALQERSAQRRNAFFAPLAALLLWGVHCAYALEAWRARHGSQVAAWLDALGEFEALSSLAAHSAAFPEDPFPTFVDGPPRFEARALSHPLLGRAKAVANDLSLSSACPLLVISGSNMSGKSTLLRAIGVNAVLAFAGAPVRASWLALTPLSVGASIRILDSLELGASRFYAEIEALRLVTAAAARAPALYLLDELFSGTNSHDRQIGAAALLASLTRSGAIGCVSTHDLALARIPSTLTPPGANFHFEDSLDRGPLSFDYTLRPGVVTRSNALALMRAAGLDIGSPDGAKLELPPMKAHVFVTLKKTVLDPQGATVARALNGMGHPEIAAVRQGKYFEIDLADGTSKADAAANLDKIAAEVLSNPVIEEYRVEIVD